MACKSSASLPYTTREKTQRRIEKEIYKESETLPLGVLPTKKDIIQCMLFLLTPENSEKTQKTTEDACYIVASNLIENWLFIFFIYFISIRGLFKKYPTFLYKAHNTINFASFIQSPSKYSPWWFTHLSQRFGHFSKHFINSSPGML